MALDKQVFKTRAITALIFAAVMLLVAVAKGVDERVLKDEQPTQV